MNMVKLELTTDEVNIILAGLGELPAKHSINLLIKVQQQAQEQLKASENVSEESE